MNNYNQLFINLNSNTVNHLVVSNYNKFAYNVLFNTQWVFNVVFLYANKGLGKTAMLQQLAYNLNGVFVSNNATLSHVTDLIQQYSIIIIDNLETTHISQQNLFAIYNLCIKYNKKLVFSSNKNLQQLNFTLTDLNTRLQGATLITLNQPSNAEIETIFKKILSQYQIHLPKLTYNYILTYSNYNLHTISITVNGIVNYVNSHKKLPNKNIILSFMQTNS